MPNEQTALYKDMADEIEKRRRAGNRNYVFSYAVNWLNIVSGMLAAIFAAVGQKTLDTQFPGYAWNFVIAALAAFPVASASAISIFKVQEKVRWYWDGKLQIGALFTELRDNQNAVVTDISTRFSALKLELEYSFPGFNAKSS